MPTGRSSVTADEMCELAGYPPGSLNGSGFENQTFDRETVERHLATLPDPGPPTWVYFIRRSDGMVKIGTSKNPERRLKDLTSAGGPMDMVAWFQGGRETEKALHELFAGDRATGEWFHPSALLGEVIQHYRPRTNVRRSMTTAETCERLRVSRTTVWRLVRLGRLTPVRISARTTLYDADEVERLACADPDDDLATLKAAYSLMATTWAEEQRPLCPACGIRRVNRGADQCTWCIQAHETDKLHKRNWWEQHGADNRAQRKAEANG